MNVINKPWVPNWQRNFKSKTEAIEKIFSSILESPGCADKDGVMAITLGNDMIHLRPKKRKKDE